MFGISITEWIFILLVVLLFFGGRKIPELARSLGKGISEFKKGIKEVESDVDTSDRPQALPPAPAANQQSYKFDPYTGKPIENKAS